MPLGSASFLATAGDESLLFAFVGLALSLLACFVFAGTETAITGMGELRIKKLLDAGRGPKRWLQLWLDEPSRVLTSLLAGNTVAQISASSLTTAVTLDLARRNGLDASLLDIAVACAVGVLTMVVLVAGEIAPKTLAKHHPEWFLPVMHFVWWFHRATHWLTQGLIWVAMHIVRALGGKHQAAGLQVTEEQIEDLVRIGSEAGAIDESRGDMLQNIFHMSETSLRTVMTPRTTVVGLPVDATFEEVVREVETSHYSRYPVYDKTLDKIVGIFYAKDLIRHCLGQQPRGFALAQHVKEALFVPETKKVIDALKEFQKESVHMAVVVDEHGGTAGIVTMEDVLEELVGDIYDEYDEPERPILQTEPSAWHIDASAELRDFAEEFDLVLPETASYSTLGGFLVDQLGHVPKEGEELRWNDLTFRVQEADDTRVVRVEIRRLELPEAPSSAAA